MCIFIWGSKKLKWIVGLKLLFTPQKGTFHFEIFKVKLQKRPRKAQKSPMILSFCQKMPNSLFLKVRKMNKLSWSLFELLKNGEMVVESTPPPTKEKVNFLDTFIKKILVIFCITIAVVFLFFFICGVIKLKLDFYESWTWDIYSSNSKR